MKTIFIDELRRSLLTIKSMIIIVSFLGIAFLVGKYSEVIALVAEGKSAIVTGMFGGFTLLGALFSFMLYASNLTREIETESIRYITPYVSRRNIFLGKFFAMTVYFFTLIFFSLLVLFITALCQIVWKASILQSVPKRVGHLVQLLFCVYQK
ncbi:hypothetical protein SAMN02745116_01937 [Pilibacter termitis]|uniref:ABC-2 family transporter protein n=1 Tax=Pilibacter termitis TaxID=263852 RepID=A0A1T4PV71_9ENTE|nr:hypothetical protein [Pilibacter termitis]SJZ95452.1 hypothetical protein SAMN02745116_01937 [Pilibacter termitis]